MKKNDSLPFGLLFEEEAVKSENPVIPIYDEEQDISVVSDKAGNLFPFVTYFGSVNTATATKTVDESSDNDETFNSLNTKTLTEAKEDSDSDENLFFSKLGTKTMTLDQSEQIDEDEDQIFLNSLSTRTETRETGESSDEDEQ